MRYASNQDGNYKVRFKRSTNNVTSEMSFAYEKSMDSDTPTEYSGY